MKKIIIEKSLPFILFVILAILCAILGIYIYITGRQDLKIDQNAVKNGKLTYVTEDETITCREESSFTNKTSTQNIYLEDKVTSQENIEIEENTYSSKEDIKKQEFLKIELIISIAFLFFSIIIHLGENTKQCNKNFENLISPILAESIIDGKTDFKNLIMTSIIEFKRRGNLEIINNNTLQYINNNGLCDYENTMMDLIFQNKSQITFSEINNMFIESKKYTEKFSDSISSIKEKILDYLEKNNLSSLKTLYFMKILNFLPLLCMTNIVFQVVPDFEELIELRIILNMLMINLYFSLIKSTRKVLLEIKDMMQKNHKLKETISKLAGIFLLCIILFTMTIVKTNYKMIILGILIFVVNFASFSINHKIVLTKKGKKERKKLLELKNYINQYSLIKDRDLQSEIIWDEYLAYATAFGIPNKIVSSIYELWYNLDIVILFFNSLL